MNAFRFTLRDGFSAAAVSVRRNAPDLTIVRGHRPSLHLLFAAVAFLFLIFTASVVAQPPAPADGVKTAVSRADEARLSAMLAADTDALDHMLTPDCLYVHSNGIVQTKAQLLTALKNGAFKYASLRYPSPPLIRFFGPGTAVLTGPMQIEVVLPDGRTLKPALVITALYVWQGGRWQLASYQSTNAPAAAAP